MSFDWFEVLVRQVFIGDDTDIKPALPSIYFHLELYL